jgi:glucose/mannose-6-phosphate isomerase
MPLESESDSEHRRLLDNVGRMKEADPGGMLAAIVDLPGQCRRAAENRVSLSVPSENHPPKRLFLLGMGGSAIGGDLLSAWLGDRTETEIRVIRNYTLPASAVAGDIAVACSYSGETEEILSAYQQARSRGLFTICLTSGGRLAEFGRNNGDPVVEVPKTVQPRAALGSFFFLLNNLTATLKIQSPDPIEINECLTLLDEMEIEYGPETAVDTNPAKRLALLLSGRFPVIYTAAGPFGPVGDRWRCQLNENAKVFAHSNVLPEMCHNEIEGYRFPEELISRMVSPTRG